MRYILLLLLTLPLAAQTPDLGPNVLLITPKTPQAEAQAAIDRIYAVQQHNEFGPERNAILFAPGTYHLDIPVGFYTQVLGLGAKPEDVHILGNVHSDASLPNNNATCTFWRGIENVWITPTGGKMQWAVSQATALRRVHVSGDLLLHQNHGWASGGWLADSVIDGIVDSGTQQQWITRNSTIGGWKGANWNMVFVEVKGAPPTAWPKPGYTTVPQTPVIREKPFLLQDERGAWRVSVPLLSEGGETATTTKAGPHSLPLSAFHIAHPGDTASVLNAALAGGKHLLFTPGIYMLEAPLQVKRVDTVLLGLGLATLQPTHGTEAVVTANASNVTLAGLLIDAGAEESPVLVRVGMKGSHGLQHAGQHTLLADVFFRVGGAGPGKAGTDLEINEPHTLVDHTWIWRADHGKGVGWDQNLSRNGLVVNADDVTVYGLFVEHHQQYQVLWNGERGRVYFYQSEIPYDPPTQAAYTSGPGTDGWASYTVADSVKQHEAWGLGIYSVFRRDNVKLSRAIESPRTPGVRFHDMVTVCLAKKGGIAHIVNDAGEPTRCADPRVDPRLTEYPSGN